MKIKLQIYPLEKIINIPKEDLEGRSEKERERLIEDWMYDEVKWLVDYEWEECE